MVGLKLQIERIIGKLSDYDGRAKSNLITEANILMGKMSIYAPIGVTGHLKNSFRTHIIDEIGFMNVQIISSVSYALRQNEDRLLHVPEEKLGQISFKSYAKGIKPSKTKLHRSTDAVRYWLGHKLAQMGEKPADRYAANYVWKALESIGGINEMKRNIMR